MATDLWTDDGRPQGWFTDEEGAAYRQYVGKAPHGSRMAEIGVFLGRSWSYVGDLACRRFSAVDLVDPWLPMGSDVDKHIRRTLGIDPARDRYADFLEINQQLLKGWDVTAEINVVRKNSHGYLADMIRAGRRHQYGLIFIDGSHDLEVVIGDICASGPLLRPNGWLLGHDYDMAGVRTAVDGVFGYPDAVYGRVWAVAASRFSGPTFRVR